MYILFGIRLCIRGIEDVSPGRFDSQPHFPVHPSSLCDILVHTTYVYVVIVSLVEFYKCAYYALQ